MGRKYLHIRKFNELFAKKTVVNIFIQRKKIVSLVKFDKFVFHVENKISASKNSRNIIFIHLRSNSMCTLL